MKKSEVLLSLNHTISKEEKHKVAKKLHRQFGHAKSIKLIKLLKNTEIIEEIMKECEVSLKYQKKKQIRPVAGFPLANEFNEYVAMDLKQWSYQNKVWLIHIVDHLTRFRTSFVKTKEERGSYIWITNKLARLDCRETNKMNVKE